MSERVLPEGWREVVLGKVLTIKHGFAFAGDGFGSDSSSPQVLTPRNFAVSGGFKHADAKSFEGDYPAEYLLNGGELVVTMTDLSKSVDTLGLLATLPVGRAFLHNQRIGLVATGPEVDPKFLEYRLRGSDYRSHIVGSASGSTVRHTSPSRIYQFACSMPGLDVQRAIAEVLGALDDKIAANNQVAASSRALALTVVSRAKVTARVDTVAEHQRQQINPATMLEGRVDHYSLPAFDAGSGPEAVSPAEIRSGKFIVTSPSVLVSKLNPRFPRIWDVPALGKWPALASTEFVVLEPREISTSLLWALLAQPSVGIELEAQVSGTSGSHQRVKPEAILSARIGDPAAISEGDRATIEGCVSRAHAVLQENLRLAATRDALLPALMSGRLTVRNAERVVADAT